VRVFDAHSEFAALFIQDLERDLHADENAEEQCRDFGDGTEIEAVIQTDLSAADGQGDEDQTELDDLAQVHRGVPFRTRDGFRRIEKSDGEDDADQKRNVREHSEELQFPGFRIVLRNIQTGFFRIGEAGIPDEVDREKDGIHEDPFLPQAHRPQEADSTQVTEEERRVTGRKEASAAVADGKNEEDDRVDLVFAFAVRFQKRTDQEHRGARRSDEAGQESTDRNEDSVRQRFGLQVAFNADAAGDREEREQKNDERNELIQNCVGESRPHSGTGSRGAGVVGRNAVPVGFQNARMSETVVDQRDQTKRRRNIEAVQVAFPPVLGSRDEREDRDGQEKECERNDHEVRRKFRFCVCVAVIVSAAFAVVVMVAFMAFFARSVSVACVGIRGSGGFRRNSCRFGSRSGNFSRKSFRI